MLSRMQQKLGTAGLVVAIVALVAALTGAAFAAGGLTKQQEKQVKKIAKKVAKPGKQGPEGKQGPAGSQGAKGDPGAPGKDGSNGTNGTNGTNGEDGMCTVGNPACELPSGSTLVGAWGTSGGKSGTTGEDLSLVPISFVQRVSPAPTALWEYEPAPGFVIGIKLEDGSASVFPSNSATEEEAVNAWEDACPGSADSPDAKAGFVCIYNKEFEGAPTAPLAAQAKAEAANEYGLVVPWGLSEGVSARGSWAVTAE